MKTDCLRWLTYFGPVLGGPSVCVEVEDDGAGGGVVSMGCDAAAPLAEDADGGREEEDWGTSDSEWELLLLDTPYNTRNTVGSKWTMKASIWCDNELLGSSLSKLSYPSEKRGKKTSIFFSKS